MKFVFGLLPAIVVLAACSSDVTPDSAPEYISVSANSGSQKTFGTTLDPKTDLTVSNASVGTVVFDNKRILRSRNAGFETYAYEAVAGFLPDPNVGSAVTSGSAEYDVSYKARIAASGTSRYGLLSSGTAKFSNHSGKTTLTANFDAGTLKGGNKKFRVNAKIDGKDLSGTASVINQKGTEPFGYTETIGSGKIKGEIGSTGVIAAFAGENGLHATSGGFVGTRN